MLSPIETIDRVLDEVFSGRWWWRARRLLAGRRLVHTLQSHGDKSMEARRATERYREMQFAVTYWRPATPPVRQVIHAARSAGVALEDLQLIVLNLSLRTVDDNVTLHRSLLVRASSAAFATCLAVHWILMCAMVAVAPVSVALRVFVILALLSLYAVLYRAWSLFGYRAIAALDRSGSTLERACGLTAQTVTASVDRRFLK